MKLKKFSTFTGQLILGSLALQAAEQPATSTKSAASADKKPAASPGLLNLNVWLRGPSDTFKLWDIGGQVRARYD